jgi:hypothetical protein
VSLELINFYPSGGPLVLNGAIFGVLSFGGATCAVTTPTAFTSIQPFWTWMVQKWIATYSITSPWWTTTTA